MKKNLIIFGTRPEAIKRAPLVKEFKKHSDKFETRVCVTAQHREILDQVLDFFDIEPDYDLDLMKANQNLLEDKIKYKKMSSLNNPYGDGTACKKNVNFMENIN